MSAQPETWNSLMQWVGEVSAMTPAERDAWLSWGISPADLDLLDMPEEHLVQDLMPVGQVALWIAPPGGGKSTLAWLFASQASMGTKVFDAFDTPGRLRVMVVDFEQTAADATILRDQMHRWKIDSSAFIWLPAADRPLDRQENVAWLCERVQKHRPHIVILDTATDAVSKPRDDESVRPMFNAVRRLMDEDGVQGMVLLAHLRKRPPGSDAERSLDDLFGSVLWATRTSAAFFLEEDALTVWKQRGNHLRRRFGKPASQPYVVLDLVRSDDEPTRVNHTAAGRDEKVTTEILTVIDAEPDTYSATSLTEKRLRLSGARRPVYRGVIARLVVDGTLIEQGQYRYLSRGPGRGDPLADGTTPPRPL